jgi:hypothetical protein
MFNRKVILLIFIIAGIAGFANCLCAQDKDNDFREKIQKIKLDKLVKKLELDTITAVTFKDKYMDYVKELREVNKKRINVYIDITQNLGSGEGLDTLVDQLISLEKQMNEMKENFTSDLRSMLTPKQFAIMIIFERKFSEEIKKLLKDYKKGK